MIVTGSMYIQSNESLTLNTFLKLFYKEKLDSKYNKSYNLHLKYG